jgi:hypothetical protein
MFLQLLKGRHRKSTFEAFNAVSDIMSGRRRTIQGLDFALAKPFAPPGAFTRIELNTGLRLQVLPEVEEKVKG